MKNKKIIIMICSLIVIALIAVLLWFLLKPNKGTKTIKLTFKDDEYKVVLTLKEDESVKLPEISAKEGFVFEGWYNGDTIVKDGDKFSEDTTIVARWNEQKPNTMVITFNTDGGNVINSMEIECESKLNLPTPTKNGYTFIDWRDKNDVVISNETKLVCENINLKANWKKIETTNNNNNTNSNNNNQTKPVEKKYSCPDGYTLSGTKCTFEEAAKNKCPDGTREDGSICVKISEYTQGTRSCGEKIVNMGGGSTPKVQGVKVDAGTTFCFYGEVSDNQSTCTSRGRYWCNSLSKCFVDRDQNYITVCSSDYQYYTSRDLLNKFGAHNNGGCYKKYSKVSYCDKEGYTLSGTKCTKIIDAIVS